MGHPGELQFCAGAFSLRRLHVIEHRRVSPPISSFPHSSYPWGTASPVPSGRCATRSAAPLPSSPFRRSASWEGVHVSGANSSTTIVAVGPLPGRAGAVHSPVRRVLVGVTHVAWCAPERCRRPRDDLAVRVVAVVGAPATAKGLADHEVGSHQVREGVCLRVAEGEGVVEKLGRGPRPGADALVALLEESAGLQGSVGLPNGTAVSPRIATSPTFALYAP